MDLLTRLQLIRHSAFEKAFKEFIYFRAKAKEAPEDVFILIMYENAKKNMGQFAKINTPQTYSRGSNGF